MRTVIHGIRRLRALGGLTPGDRGLVLRAVLLVWKYRLALWILPWSRFGSRLEGTVGHAGQRRSLSAGGASELVSPHRIAWAVRAGSLGVPRSNCLVRALAAQDLLHRHGHPSRIRLGSGRDEAGAFVAHAWLEGMRGEGVLIGGEELERYGPFHPRRGGDG